MPFKADLLNLSKFLNCSYTHLPNEPIVPFYLPADSDPTLVFESRFECGNLWMALKISDNEYDLILQNDINTKGHTQWYYFKVSNTRKDLKVKFNIINLRKLGSLYNSGMKIAVRSDLGKTGWGRAGEEISYFCNGIRRNRAGKSFYTLTFSYIFEKNADVVHFAYSVPYSFTSLMSFLREIEGDPLRKSVMARRLLTYTLTGNRCDYLTVSAPSAPENLKKSKKGVVVTARVHPGETVGSWMMHGFLDFITGNSKEARVLRENFVFKIIPMLNPDGVINGNYRCNLAGVDLNRRWKDPNKNLHPTVFAAKKMIKEFSREREIELICDLHGHSRKHNIFMYGCDIQAFPEKTREYPYTLSKISNFFSYKYCTFNIHKSKESTMRVALFKETKVPNIYTLEASFAGCNFGLLEGSHFSTGDFKKMGEEIGVALMLINNLSVDLKFEVNNRTEVLELMKKDPVAMENHEESSSGSDSDPSEDDLDSQVLAKLLEPVKQKTTRNSQISPQRKATLSLNISAKTNKTRTSSLISSRKCPHCGEIEDKLHICAKSKTSSKAGIISIIKPVKNRETPLKRNVFLNLNATTSAFSIPNYYRSPEGKRVRDQATQTDSVITPRKIDSILQLKCFPDISENAEMATSESNLQSEKTFLPYLTKGKKFMYDRNLRANTNN